MWRSGVHSLQQCLECKPTNQRRVYSIKRLLLILLLFLIIPVGYATPNPVPVIGGYFEPGGYYGGYAGHHYWVNYCPMCHRYGILTKNPKGTYEGELTCSRCDCDFDGCTGGEKAGGGARGWLISATQEQIDMWYHPNKTKKVKKSTPTAPQDPTIDISGITIKQSTYNHIQFHLNKWTL